MTQGEKLAPGVYCHGRKIRATFTVTVRCAGLGIVSKRFFKSFPRDTPLDEIAQWQREQKAAMLVEINRPRRPRRKVRPLSDEAGALRAHAERLVCAIAELERRIRALELAERESH